MTYLYSFIMGVIQGLTEFLPVSSSGHLTIIKMLFGETSSGNLFFEILLHLGTLVAVVVAFRQDIWEIIRDFFGIFPPLFRKEKPAYTPGLKLLVLLIISLLPLFIVLPFMDLIETAFATPIVVGFTLLITAAMLILADHFKPGKKNISTATWKDALIVGLFHIIAVTPGISRSGTAITAGLGCGFTRRFAVKFSFLMSLPTILAAFALEFIKSYDTIDTSLIGQYIVGFITSAIVGYLAIWLVRLVASKGKFTAFGIYCAAAGAFTITWCLLAA